MRIPGTRVPEPPAEIDNAPAQKPKEPERAATFVRDDTSSPLVVPQARPDSIAQRIALQFPQTGEAPSLAARISVLCAKWPQNVRLVSGVRFSFDADQSMSREVMQISVGTLDDAQKAELLADYVAAMGTDTVSFPLREKATHMRVRCGGDSVDFSEKGFVRGAYRLPSPGTTRLETTLMLDMGEAKRLAAYVARAEAQTAKVLGEYTMGDGPAKVTGKPNDNRPLCGGRHNCTSWIAMAPIGQNGEQLRALAGEPPSAELHDNCGWFTMFLAGASQSPRAKTLVYWSDVPLTPSQKLEWDFNPITDAADLTANH